MLIKCAFVGHKKLGYLSKCTVLQQQKLFTHCLNIQKRNGEEVKILGNKWPTVNTEAVQKKIVICTDFTFCKIFIQI
jgi:hypothetical protein